MQLTSGDCSSIPVLTGKARIEEKQKIQKLHVDAGCTWEHCSDDSCHCDFSTGRPVVSSTASRPFNRRCWAVTVSACTLTQQPVRRRRQGRPAGGGGLRQLQGEYLLSGRASQVIRNGNTLLTDQVFSSIPSVQKLLTQGSGNDPRPHRQNPDSTLVSRRDQGNEGS